MNRTIAVTGSILGMIGSLFGFSGHHHKPGKPSAPVTTAPVTPPVTTPPATVPPTTAPTAPATDITAAPTGNVVSDGRTWKLSNVQDFDTDAAPGAFGKTYPGMGGADYGKYLDSQTISVTNSALQINTRHIGSVDAGGWIALLPNASSTGAWAYTGNVRFSFRIKSTNAGTGYGTAAMLSVNNNADWTRDGEMDVWEGSNGGNANIFHHLPGNPNNKIQTNLGSTTDYHTITVEWVGGVSTTYYRDGVKIASYGASQTAAASAAFLAVIQTAASDNTDNGAPDTSTSQVAIDWMASWQL